MDPQKLETGDLFERDQRGWIRSNLSEYENIWSTFIGHDGRGAAFPITSDNQSLQERHSRFCQHHYSMALFAYLLDRHTKESVRLMQQDADSSAGLTAERYLRDTQNLTTFVALLGQVCDMVESMAAKSALHENSIAKTIQDFMKQRNNAIHGARIPMAWDYVGVSIARIAQQGNASGWHKEALWSDMERKDFVYLHEWMEETNRGLLETLNTRTLPAVWGTAKKLFAEKSLPQRGAAGSSFGSTLTQQASSTNPIYVRPSGT